MADLGVDPFKNLRKNGHIWRGEKALIWYHEALDGSFRVLVFYDFDDRKRCVNLEVDDKNRRVEFTNNDLTPEKYAELSKEVEFMESVMKQEPDQKP